MNNAMNTTTRRNFLSNAALGTMGAAAPWAINLAAMANAAAQSSQGDYKALVCIFMLGGNDHYNMIIPYDLESYNSYASVRKSTDGDTTKTIAIDRGALAATELKPINTMNGRSFALHPNMKGLMPLFDSEKLGVVLNVGTLEMPTTISDFKANRGLPPKLFSHNDQTTTWQRSEIQSKTGYGGRITDSFPNPDPIIDLLTAVNVGGSTFLANLGGAGYRLGVSGAVSLNTFFNNPIAKQGVIDVLSRSSSNYFEQAYINMAKQAQTSASVVNSAFNSVNIPPFPRTPTALDSQLAAIAKLIGARNSLRVNRQVFFASLGGFDTHAGMPENHSALMQQISDSMSWFYSATEHLGVAKQVTTFTGSDFGRTLSSNGNGSDHGWGSFHMVMGGAVKGKRWYGEPPVIAVNGPNDVGSGRLLPAVSVDQYMATFATWLGVPASKLISVVPRINRYPSKDLGFMQSI